MTEAMSPVTVGPTSRPSFFRHEALLYDTEAGFVRDTVSFVRTGLEAEEPVFAVFTPSKARVLRDALGPDAPRVHFVDMEEVGRNPSRLIAVLRAFLADHVVGAQRVRGLAEPVWAYRSPGETADAAHLEGLINSASSDLSSLWLLCPYGVSGLDPTIVAVACANHPYLVRHGAGHRSGDSSAATNIFAGHLRQPVGAMIAIEVTAARELAEVRHRVLSYLNEVGLQYDRVGAFLLAVNEAAANGLSHGGGRGRLRLWATADSVVCEVESDGRFADPMAGDVLPPRDAESGRGMWLMHQGCDLVQVRTSPEATVVSMLVRRL